MNTFAHRSRSLVSRNASAFWAAAFLFFLIYSAPHQVHHVFEQLPQAPHHDGGHEHPNKGGGHGSSTEPKCVFQISASRCHVGVAGQIAVVLLQRLIRRLPLLDFTGHRSTDFVATFQIRAPPASLA